MKDQLGALPGPEERKRIVEFAKRVTMQARELLECLPAFQHYANRLEYELEGDADEDVVWPR